MKSDETFSVKPKHAVVILSGGMDSAICLALCVKNFGYQHTSAITFDYGQRHQNEKESAKIIAKHFKVDQVTIDLPFFSQLTTNALIDHQRSLVEAQEEFASPNTLVVGRNGLFARLGAIYAHHIKASHLFLGVLGLEAANSGYHDCSRKYFDLMEQILRIDLGTENFWIHTPLVDMTKKETLELAASLESLEFILENSITCYDGIKGIGCQKCAACVLRNTGIKEYLQSHPSCNFSYRSNF